jgi:hypothetical protein
MSFLLRKPPPVLVDRMSREAALRAAVALRKVADGSDSDEVGVFLSVNNGGGFLKAPTCLKGISYGYEREP